MYLLSSRTLKDQLEPVMRSPRSTPHSQRAPQLVASLRASVANHRVLHALFEARRRVPDEVSVVGFGGAPEGEFFNPPLTTIRQNFAEIGRRGAELPQAGIEAGRLAAVQEMIPAELIIRASTGAAA